VIALHGAADWPGIRSGAAALSRLGGAIAEDGLRGAVAGQLTASRELGPQCRVKERKRAGRRERVADSCAARQWLLQQSWVAQDRISLIGWAHGASAGLWAVRPQTRLAQQGAGLPLGDRFYPECRISSRTGCERAGADIAADRRKDDVASPPLCKQMVDGARGRSALARIVVYPAAPHDFDRANLPLRALDGNDPRRPSTAISAPMRMPATTRRSRFRPGWRGELFTLQGRADPRTGCP
jgi:dienelactone hydrolase